MLLEYSHELSHSFTAVSTVIYNHYHTSLLRTGQCNIMLPVGNALIHQVTAIFTVFLNV